MNKIRPGSITYYSPSSTCTISIADAKRLQRQQQQEEMKIHDSGTNSTRGKCPFPGWKWSEKSQGWVPGYMEV